MIYLDAYSKIWKQWYFLALCIYGFSKVWIKKKKEELQEIPPN